MTQVQIPFLGEGIDKVEISKWHFNQGDQVSAGDDLVEVSADKAIFDVPCEKSGILKEILVPEGREAKINDILAVIDNG